MVQHEAEVAGTPRERFDRAFRRHVDASEAVARWRGERDRVTDELEDARALAKLRELEVVGSDSVQNPPADDSGRRAPNNEQTRAAAAQRILSGDPTYLGHQATVARLVANLRAVDIALEVARDDRSRAIERARFEVADAYREAEAMAGTMLHMHALERVNEPLRNAWVSEGALDALQAKREEVPGA